ncbi:MAG: hypothetical protein HY652_01345 [Acidobacteria bacterium]|nr:hypothetical protein [Acidobacteriota bacterium]
MILDKWTRRKKFIGGLLTLLAVTSAIALAKAFWEEKAYTQWTRKEVERVLTDSPWVESQSFSEVNMEGPARPVMSRPPGESSAEGPGTADSGPAPQPTPQAPADYTRGPDPQTPALYLVRWFSAKPVRMALAQSALLNGGSDPKQAEDFVNQDLGNFIVISVHAARGQDLQELEGLTKAAVKADTFLIKKNKERLEIAEFNPISRGSRTMLFLFPRTVDGKPSIILEDKEVRFVTRLGKHKISCKFKLQDMIFRGQLEL